MEKLLMAKEDLEEFIRFIEMADLGSEKIEIVYIELNNMIKQYLKINGLSIRGKAIVLK